MNGQRHHIILPALCWNQRRSDFYAITTDVSSEGIRFRSASRLSAGENFTCSIRHIGLLKVGIEQVSGQEFVAAARGGRSVLAELARQFVTLALALAQDLCAEPFRIHRRIVPKQTIVIVTLECGSALSGHVLNVSASGVALLVERVLAIGTEIRVGQKRARVIRHFAPGLGAAFVEPFEPGAIDEAMTL